MGESYICAQPGAAHKTGLPKPRGVQGLGHYRTQSEL